MWRGPSTLKGYASVPNGTELAKGAVLFHDCQKTELTYRQVRNHREADLSPYGMRLDVFRFDGSFLSVVLDLPAGAIVVWCLALTALLFALLSRKGV